MYSLQDTVDQYLDLPNQLSAKKLKQNFNFTF